MSGAALSSSKGRVLVTGATGFLASHVVNLLLAQGYPVRGTVRNVKKAVHLQQWIAEGKDLELVEADLLDADSWKAAVKGCVVVMHVASPVDLAISSRHAEERMVRPAVEGTMNVLRAAAAEGIKRVVLTSSLAAIATPATSARCAREGKPIDASMYTELDCPIPYYRAKIRAETAAWDFVRSDEGKGMELAVISPGMIVGSPLSENVNEGLEILMETLTGKHPLIPRVQDPLVHVLDVAEAHIRAMEVPEAAGKRFLMVQDVTDLLEIARYLAPRFNPLGYKVTTTKLPKWAVPLVVGVDRRLKRTREMVEVKNEYDVQLARDMLGVRGRPCMPVFIDMAIDAVERGQLRRTPAFDAWLNDRRLAQSTAVAAALAEVKQGPTAVPVSRVLVAAGGGRDVEAPSVVVQQRASEEGA